MAPVPPPLWPVPKLDLRIDDLDHEGADIFLNAVQPKVALREAILASFKWLYTPETVPRTYEFLRPFFPYNNASLIGVVVV